MASMQEFEEAEQPVNAEVGIVDAYLAAWRRAFDYGGVSSRREYWVFVITHWFVLFPVIGLIALNRPWSEVWGTPGIIFLVHFVAICVATLPLTIRRVRDATSSGWFTFLIIASPLLILAIACCRTYDANWLANLPDSYWSVWRRTSDYMGVSKRAEFWRFTLINFVALIGTIVLGRLVTPDVPSVDLNTPELVTRLFFSALYVIVFFAILSSTLAWMPLVVRRFRDATGTGLGAYIAFLLFLFGGVIAIAIICMLPSRRPKPSSGGNGELVRVVDSANHDDADTWGRGAPSASQQ